MDEAVKLVTRALIRTNLMRSLYQHEVNRTNRIGVSLTGLHEYAWHVYGVNFADMIRGRADPFWSRIGELSRLVIDTAREYSKELGLVEPDTSLTVKPAGTTSKLFGLTEGVHLPSMAFYLRWVQFKSEDPLLDEYRAKGYPVQGPLKTYAGHHISGFPTITELGRIMPADKLITASEATIAEQYDWLELIEHYWLNGAGWDGYTGKGGQISYTLKYSPDDVSMDELAKVMAERQPKIKACSIMPQARGTAYEYQPEQPITRDEFAAYMERIETMREDIDMVHIDCPTGACPVTFNKDP